LIDTAMMSDAGDYDVEVSNTCSPKALSSKITIYMIPTTQVSVEPEDIEKIDGESLSVGFTAIGQDLKYQWYKGTDKLLDENNPTLVISKINLRDSGYYHCVVTGTCGSDTTRDFKISVQRDVGIEIIPNYTPALRISRLTYDKREIVLLVDCRNEGNLSIGIFDYTGNLISSRSLTGLLQGMNEIRLNKPELSNGFYWIRVWDGNNSDYSKMIIIE